MIEWMDEWMNEWMEGWMNGWMNEWMNKWMNETWWVVKTIENSYHSTWEGDDQMVLWFFAAYGSMDGLTIHKTIDTKSTKTAVWQSNMPVLTVYNDIYFIKNHQTFRYVLSKEIEFKDESSGNQRFSHEIRVSEMNRIDRRKVVWYFDNNCS